MVLRATNQLIEVLGPGAGGTLRVTNQLVEVLATPYPDLEPSLTSEIEFTTLARALENAENEIEFTQELLVARPWYLDVTSTIAFSDSGWYVGPKPVEAASLLELEGVTREPGIYSFDETSEIAFTQAIGVGGQLHYDLTSTIVLAQIADLTEKPRESENNLEFTSVATTELIKVIGSTLEFTQATEKGISYLSVESTLALNQEPRLNPINRSIEQEFEFIQTVRNSAKSLLVTSELDFTTTLVVTQPWTLSSESIMQWVTEDGWDADYNPITTLYGLQDAVELEKITNRYATSLLDIQQTVQKILIKAAAIDANAASIIAFDSRVPEIIYLDLSNELELDTEVDLHAEHSLTELVIESTVTYNVNYAPRLASSELNFISSFFGETESPDLCNYSPFLGSTTDPDAPQQFLKNTPSLDANATGITLFYPWEVPTNTVTLRGPDLGNRNRLEFQRIKRETRGGTLIVWADPIWPKNERLVLSFSGLTEVEGQSVLDFLYLTLGKEIGLVDWEGNTQRAIIITPSESIVRNSRENLSINLEFEISRSVLRGRCTSELTFVDTLATSVVRPRTLITGLTLGTAEEMVLI